MKMNAPGSAVAVICISLAASSTQVKATEIQMISDKELDTVIAGNAFESAVRNLNEILDGISVFTGTRELNEAAENAQDFGRPIEDVIENVNDPNANIDFVEANRQFRRGFLNSFRDLFNAGSSFPGTVAPSAPPPESDVSFEGI